MRRFVSSAIAALLLAVGSPAHAIYQNNVTVDTLGVINNLGFFNVVGGVNGTCLHSFVYIDLTSIGGRSVYALLMAAKMTGTPLELIEYAEDEKTHLDPQELCYLFQAAIDD